MDYTKGNNNMIVFCKQCERATWAKRSTKKYCSNKCKQLAKRGVEPEYHWNLFNDAHEAARLQFIEVLYEENKAVAHDLEVVKSKYGRNAMLAAVDVLMKYSR